MRELKYKPEAFWKLDGSSPFTDYSGYSRSATATGTAVNGLPLAESTTKSYLFDKDRVGTFTCPVFQVPNRPFTLSAIIYPVYKTTTENQAVLSHTGETDGIRLEGSKLQFLTKYTAEGEALCEVNIDTTQKLDVVAVHTADKNQLYVNGELVSEVDITVEQQADTYDMSATTLSAGGGTSTQGFLMNNVGVYSSALNGEQIADMYKYNNTRSAGSPAKGYAGEDIVFNRGARPHFLKREWNDAAEWNLGVFDGTTLDGDALNAQIEDGLTINGWWTDSVYLKNADTYSAIDAINLDWTGENATVQVSVNETTWETVTRGKNITTIPQGFVPSGQELYVRANFTSGLSDAYLTDLRVDGYLEGTVTPVSGRVITYNNVVNRYEHHIAEMRDDYGATIGTGGSIVVGPDTDEAPLTWRTMEIWVKPAATFVVSTTGVPDPPDYIYTNGVPGGATSLLGQWTVYHYVYPEAVNPTITISSAGIVGKVALYPSALSQTDINNIIANTFGIATSSQGSFGAMTISEPATSVSIIDPTTLQEVVF